MTSNQTFVSDRLPLPPRKFQGTIGTTYTDSQPEVPDSLSAPEGAPNVLVILLDDVGFGHASTFGGPVIFMAEVAKYNVLPLDDRFAERADTSLRPSYIRGKQRFVYLPGTVRVPEPSAPNTKNINHTLAAEITIPEGGAEGVLVCCGGMAAGYTFFIKGNKLHWEHNWFEQDRYRVSSTETLPSGHHIVSAEIKVDEEGKLGTGGMVTLRLGEKVIGEGRFEKQVPYGFTVNETFDIGCDTVTPVSEAYESPFEFTGQIKRVLVDISDASFEDLATKAKIAMALQ